ncbi:hypothetical protein SAMN05421754_10475 [Nitrosomonas sp. Nm58]|nr:hypothetical protein SAMN05421754_10475 [Nitrosomonas sp. Nm58]
MLIAFFKNLELRIWNTVSMYIIYQQYLKPINPEVPMFLKRISLFFGLVFRYQFYFDLLDEISESENKVKHIKSL